MFRSVAITISYLFIASNATKRNFILSLFVVNRLEKQESLNLSKEEVEAYIENYYRQFIRAREEKDDERLKPIVQNFVEKVVVYEEEIEVVLKITLVGPLVTDGGGGAYWTVTKVVTYPVPRS